MSLRTGPDGRTGTIRNELSVVYVECVREEFQGDLFEVLNLLFEQLSIKLSDEFSVKNHFKSLSRL